MVSCRLEALLFATTRRNVDYAWRARHPSTIHINNSSTVAQCFVS